MECMSTILKFLRTIMYPKISLSLAGPTVAQLEAFFIHVLYLSQEHISLFHYSLLIDLIVSLC